MDELPIRGRKRAQRSSSSESTAAVELPRRQRRPTLQWNEQLLVSKNVDRIECLPAADRQWAARRQHSVIKPKSVNSEMADSLTVGISDLSLDPVTHCEIDALTDLRERMSGADVDRLKSHQRQIDEARFKELQKLLQAKLNAAGVDDHSTLEEITQVLADAFKPWKGIETVGKEDNARQKAYPAVAPVKRHLKDPQGKRKHAELAI